MRPHPSGILQRLARRLGLTSNRALRRPTHALDDEAPADAANAWLADDDAALPPRPKRERARGALAAWAASANRQAERWWRMLPPNRQDRLATFGPLVSVLLFLGAISTSFWYLRAEEIDRTREAVQRDAEVVQQQIRSRLLDNQEQWAQLVRRLHPSDPVPSELATPAAALMAQRPEVRRLLWITPERQVLVDLRAGYAGYYPRPPLQGNRQDASLPNAGGGGEPEATLRAAQDARMPMFSAPFTASDGKPVLQQVLPLNDLGQFAGAVIVEYDLDALLRALVSADILSRHGVGIVGANQSVLASTLSQPPRQSAPGLVAQLPLDPMGSGLSLRVWGKPASSGLIGNTLFWMVVALSVFTLWMLLVSWRHTQRRSQIQAELLNETNFRRAMENSMLTGMRAMDREGRVTYVNPAFCAMTGFAEAELVGLTPPFPYWPADRYEENTRLLHQELQGRSPAGGIEVRVQRKDGSQFDGRMYVSPLIDHKGQQTGWMTSMTNITEAKRARDQLAASHERFTTVLEGLDAVVSVAAAGRSELLFANRSYRLWFGHDAAGHALLANNPDRRSFWRAAATAEDGSDSGTSAQHEVNVAALNMWFDVRVREMTWTDGRAAQMLVATDITGRRRAEEQARLQAEQAQMSSRLITMGEMASAVAHELNQPLTAIANYCSGMIGRISGQHIEPRDLIAPLEKTAHQAQRAGQIIHRIRHFVKRSEPKRVVSRLEPIIEESVELAGIELRRRSVRLQLSLPHDPPHLLVDPILIEQVLLNLLRNAAEAIDGAKLPPQRRLVELIVELAPGSQEAIAAGASAGALRFRVRDHGPGLDEQSKERLFESFFSTKRDGLGIGLPLCRSIVESHQGHMTVANLYNENHVVGCEFVFTLPCVPAPSQPEEQP